MRVKEFAAGPGDCSTWGPCTGHPNDPRTDFQTPDENDPEFKAIYTKKLDHIVRHVCGELSLARTSHGITDLVADEFGAILAAIPKSDVQKIMFALCWNGAEKDALTLLDSIFEKACQKLAEDQTITELGW